MKRAYEDGMIQKIMHSITVDLSVRAATQLLHFVIGAFFLSRNYSKNAFKCTKNDETQLMGDSQRDIAGAQVEDV
jgi:hypothetical protein